MAIIYVLFAFFVLLTLYDFKKGVLLFMPFKLFFWNECKVVAEYDG